MRRHLATIAIAVSVIAMAAPASAQSGPSVGDEGPVEAAFYETDEACGYIDFSDVYTASLGEDEQGRFIDLVRPSAGDSARVRLNEAGDPSIESGRDDEIWEHAGIDVEASALYAFYGYVSGGCTQTWQAWLIMPRGFLSFLADDPARVAEEAAPPPEEAAPPPEEAAPPPEEAAPPPEEAAPPPEEETAAPTEELAQSDTSTGGDSGLSIFVWILIAAFVALFGWGLFWYFFRRPQRLYRFDRGDPGEFVDEEDSTEIIISGSELPTFGSIEEGQDVFIPPRASTIEIDEPPAHRLCDSTHEAWRKSVEQLAELEAEDDARVGSDDPIPEIHQRMLDQARASMNAYRRIYEECLDAHPEHEPEAPPPSQPGGDTPEPSAEDDADTGEGEETDGGDETESGDEADSGAPGIVTPPPVVPGVINDPTDEMDPSDCKPDGLSEIRPESGLPEAQFTVLTGPVLLPATGPIGSWNRTFGGRSGGLSGEELLHLSDGAVETALSDAEQIDNILTTRFEVKALIPTATYKVSCGRVWRCEKGSWTKTSETARLPDELIAEDVETISGHSAKSMAAQVTENVSKAKGRVEVLMSNQEKMALFGCD